MKRFNALATTMSVTRRAETVALVALTLALSALACGNSDPAPATKPAPTSAQQEPAYKDIRVVRKTTMGQKLPAATGDKSAQGADKLTDLGGLQANAVPAQSLQALDGVAQFSLGDDKLGCFEYGKNTATFFTSFQGEFESLEKSFTPNEAGVAAIRKFSGFLKKSAAEMKTVKVEGDQLATAHEEFVATIEDLSGGFDELAGGLETKSEEHTRAAAGRVQNAVNNFKTSLDKLVAICGE